MCGMCGAASLDGKPIADLERKLGAMNDLIAHRGPDDDGVWMHERRHVGFAHRRLSIIDLDHGHQPMSDEAGRWITYNGEVFNYPELRSEIGASNFQTNCDTEVVLRAHGKWGPAALDRMRGMFAYGLWDEQTDVLHLARDRFGIKPLYYTVADGVLYFASEAKALLPFVASIETDIEGLKDYLAFQFCLAGKTLFKGINELLPGHRLELKRGSVTVSRYWDVFYELDYNHTERHFAERVEELLHESARLHLRSDVPVAAYLSGGLDSSTVASLTALYADDQVKAYTGRFPEDSRYDESGYAQALADFRNIDLSVIDIGVDDFMETIRKVIYHLDQPAAGPGSFPQYMVSARAAQDSKVIVGGQGGDEIFGGYTRYLIAYFEQCIKGAIDGTMDSGNYVVTYESIIPNLTSLQSYKPLLKQFWSKGLFEDLDARYFALINRTPQIGDEIDMAALGDYSPSRPSRRSSTATTSGTSRTSTR